MRVIGTASVFRHGATLYTDVFPDLAEEGLAIVGGSVQEVARRFPKEPRFVSSPAVRALGTTSRAMEAYGMAWREEDVRIEPALGPIHVADAAKAFARFDEVTHGLTNPLEVHRVWDRFYMEHPDYEAGVLCESRSSARQRFLGFLPGVPAMASPERHVVIVTHIETIGCAIHQWFGLDGDYFGPGEAAHFEFLGGGGLRVEFRGRRKVIAF